MNEEENIIYFLQKVRLELLKRLKDGSINEEYKKIIRSLNSPDFRAQNVVCDCYNVETLNNNDLIELSLARINQFYKRDKKEYFRICRNGQYVVWVTVFRCAENLIKIKNSLNSSDYSLRPSDYFGSCDIVKNYLNNLANAYKEIVILEKRMGIERYLATSSLKKDMELLHGILREVRAICNKKLEDFMKIFQIQWNLTSVSKAIKRSLDYDVNDDEISSSMIQHQERVIYLLLDGFGYTQYLWFLSGLKERKSQTFGINLFEWLKSYGEYQDKLILGSTLVTDTASAMSTIFSGELPLKTGVLASKIFDGRRIVDIKRTEGNDILNLVKKYPDTFLNDMQDVDVLVLQGSSYVTGDKKSFSGMIYGDSKVDAIDPIDRIFKAIAEKISFVNKQLIIAYLPLIDRTGHSIGAFTSFESYEYEKLNILLVDFLLDLAYNKKEIFDGKTKIIISADHGMFETSSNHVTLKEIKNEFYKHNIRPPMIAVNNRSLILYNVYKNSFDLSKRIMKELLLSKKISHKIFDGEDEFSKYFVPLSNRYDTKTMVILFDSDGIALTRDKNEILIHNGGHGGASCEEIFVPFITIELTSNLHSELINHFSKIK